MLEGSGQRVHHYSSPHLIQFHERIRLAGTPIKEELLTAILEECERANKGEPITFFEITTAAAILAFARNPAERAFASISSSSGARPFQGPPEMWKWLKWTGTPESRPMSSASCTDSAPA